MIPSRRLILDALVLAGASPVLASGEAALLQGVEGDHPAGYYRRAADLMRAGRRDEAVFVFYLGQLRYRTHLAARPDLRVRRRQRQARVPAYRTSARPKRERRGSSEIATRLPGARRAGRSDR